MTSPTTPTINRIVPMVWIEMPETVAVTAHLRIAPMAIRAMDVPIPMPFRMPSRPQYHACHECIVGSDVGYIRSSCRAQGLPGHDPADRYREGRAARRRDRRDRRVPVGH